MGREDITDREEAKMAGPFPGMDPYLEDAVLWPGVHQGLITGIRNALNRLLPPGFVADMGERIYVVQPDRNIYPDVVVFEQQSPVQPAQASGAAAVADPPPVVQVEPTEVREVFVEIVAVGEETRVVTVIELLSHSNKAHGREGRALYLDKQKELLLSDVNFVEIDLLRGGEHTAAVPRQTRFPQIRWDFLVCLHRAGQRGRFETWPRTLRERLPRFSVPLATDLPDIALDLQAAFDANYDDGAYARRVDYRRDPSVTLTGDDAAWADGLLRSAGLRP